MVCCEVLYRKKKNEIRTVDRLTLDMASWKGLCIVRATNIENAIKKNVMPMTAQDVFEEKARDKRFADAEKNQKRADDKSFKNTAESNTEAEELINS